MDENFVDLVHDCIGIFRTDTIRQWCKTHHIAEHHGDLFVFALYLLSLRQDFLGNAFWQISLYLRELLVKGEVFGLRLGPSDSRRLVQVAAAFVAEASVGVVSVLALRTYLL
jgi:hypothetical protein